MFVVTKGQRHPCFASVREIDSSFVERQGECLLLREPESWTELERSARDYYGRLTRAAESIFLWLDDFLPDDLKARIVADQAAWLSFRKTRFAALNLLYGLLSGTMTSADRTALHLARAAVVRNRALELEDFYLQFHARRRHAGLAAVR